MPSNLRPLLLRALITWAIGMVLWFTQEKVSRALWPEQKMFQLLGSLLFPDYQLRSGDGARDNNFQLNRLQDAAKSQPFLVNTTEDSENTFAAHPLSPSDLAVLLHALQRNGVESVMLGAPHAWENADPFAIDALEMVCEPFTRCITSCPVSRSASDGAMPAAFMRASIAASAVKGNISLWPLVNRVSLPDCFLGKEKTWAGFSQIESEEPDAMHAHLVARWDDRIIFSQALLALLAHEKVAPEEIEIIAGDSIRLPRQGKYLPIDAYGRIEINSSAALPAADLLAEQLIRPEPTQLALLSRHTEPVHILDQSKERSAAHLENQQLLHRTLLSLHQSPQISATIQVSRLPIWVEILLLAALALQFVTIFSLERTTQGIALLLLAVLTLLAIRIGHTWLPLFPSLAMLGHAMLWRIPEGSIATKKNKELTITFLPSEGPYILDEPTVEAPKKPSKASKKKLPSPAEPEPLHSPEPEPIVISEPTPVEPEITETTASKPTKKPAAATKKAKKAARNRKKG